MGRKKRRAEAREKSKDKVSPVPFTIRLGCYAVILLASMGLYYGSWLPLRKAQALYKAVNPGRVSTKELEKGFDNVLALKSPIGQEPSRNYILDTELELMQSASYGTAHELARHAESILDPKSAYYTQDLDSVSSMYFYLWKAYQEPIDAGVAIGYAKEMHERSPKLPQPLYLLSELYRDTGESEKEAEIRKLILTYWPDSP